MSHVLSESDERTLNNDLNAVRHQYRILTDAEKTGMVHIKDMGLGLIRAIEANVPQSMEREVAVERIREGVMWAVNGLTK